jgi:hypothetical protein
MQNSKEKYITFTSFANAYALKKGLLDLDISLCCAEKNPLFPIEKFEGNFEKNDWLFFTEESSLEKALNGYINGEYLPKFFKSNLLDDKWVLASWLSKNNLLIQGLNQWRLDQLDIVSFPCLLKSKRSWQGEIKLPRGWVCQTRHEAEDRLKGIEKFENWKNIFFFQEWLGHQDCRVVSVCGFHDAKDSSRSLTAIVERIASHTTGLSCSAAVQTIHDDWNLQVKNAEILDALSFTGPYEMEYLIVGERAVVLELNPRFWMQHAIFVIRGNGLIKRYLGRETEKDKKNNHVDDVVWVDSIHLLISIARLNFSLLFLVFKKYFEPGRHVLLWPSIPMAIFVVSRMVYTKIGARFKNEINKLR